VARHGSADRRQAPVSLAGSSLSGTAAEKKELNTMNTYKVTAAMNLRRTLYVTAASPEHAIEPIADGEQERDGGKITHILDKEDGYDVIDVTEDLDLTPDFAGV
jgi:hypothetical protein